MLGSLPALAAYLADPAHDGSGARLLLLDNRNRVLADEPSPVDLDPSPPALRSALRRALELHATALLLIDRDMAGPDGFTPARGRAAVALRDAASLLSVTFHDRILAGEELRSYRSAGLLG